MREQENAAFDTAGISNPYMITVAKSIEDLIYV